VTGALRTWRIRLVVLCLAAFTAAVTSAEAAPNVVPRPICCMPSGVVTAIAVDGNTAYVGGTFRHVGLARHHLAVLDPTNGQAQDGWPGVDGGFVQASVSDGLGGWYLAGDFTSIGGVARAGLAHILADKSIDPNWTPTTDGQVMALAQLSGVVYIGGQFSKVNGTDRANLAAVDGTTGQVTSFVADAAAASGTASVDALVTSSHFTAPPPTGTLVTRLYVGGHFSSINGNVQQNFAILNLADGTPVSTSLAVTGTVAAIALKGGGFATRTAYIGGSFNSASPTATTRNNLAAFDENGVFDTNWNPNANNSVSAIAVGSGKVYIGGAFDQVHGAGHSHLVAVNQTDGSPSSVWKASVSNSLPAFLNIGSIVASAGDVYVAGRFTGANTDARSNLAAFDPVTGALLSSWDPDPPGLNRGVTHLNSDGTSMIVSGEFEEIGGPLRDHIAAFDLNTGQLTGFDPNANGDVDALALQGGTLYAGGAFTTVNGALTRRGAAAFGTATGQATGFDPNVGGGNVYALATAGSTVFLGGDFLTVNGPTSRTGVAEVEAGSGSLTSFRQDLNGDARALLLNDGTLYVGGNFTQIGSEARPYLAAVHPDPGGTGSVTSFNPSPDFVVRSLLAHGNTLYAAGDFQHAQGVTRNNVAAFDAGTGGLTPFDPNVDNPTYALAADGSELFLAGPNVTTVSSLPRQAVASVDFGTGLANSWSPTLPPPAGGNALGTSPEGGLVVGGSALAGNGSSAGYLAAFALPPAAPAAPTATAGAHEAAVNFVPPPNGGSPISEYTVTASPGGQSAAGTASPITVTGLTPGATYTFTVKAFNAVGEGTPSPASNPVTLPAATPPGGHPGGPATLHASSFRVTHRRFAVAKGKTALSAKVVRGTAFAFNLSASAVSRITIARQSRGAKKGKRCVAPRKGLHQRCTRVQKKGTLVRKHTRAGSNTVPFSGRLGKHALSPGAYRATLVATDAAGHRTKPLSLIFTVVRG
jgi:hypothetical protein